MILYTPEKIKYLRESNNMTQAELARLLGITRSGVNAWEMGLSTPSTIYIVKIAELFNVSTDYLLGVEKTASISLDGLTEDDINTAHNLIEYMRKKNIK